jgi:hypothetical protein
MNPLNIKDILVLIFGYISSKDLLRMRYVSKQWKDIIENLNEETKLLLKIFRNQVKVSKFIRNKKNVFWVDQKVFPEIDNGTLMKMVPRQNYSETHYAFTVSGNIKTVMFEGKSFLFDVRDPFRFYPEKISVWSKGVVEFISDQSFVDYIVAGKYLVVLKNEHSIDLRIITKDKALCPLNSTIPKKINKFDINGKLFVCFNKFENLSISGWYDFSSNTLHTSKDFMVYCKELDLYISKKYIYDFNRKKKKSIQSLIPQQYKLLKIKVIDCIVIYKFSNNTFGLLDLLDMSIRFITFGTKMKLADMSSFTRMALFIEPKKKSNPKISVYCIREMNLIRNLQLETKEMIKHCEFNEKGILAITNTCFFQFKIL